MDEWRKGKGGCYLMMSIEGEGDGENRESLNEAGGGIKATPNRQCMQWRGVDDMVSMRQDRQKQACLVVAHPELLDGGQLLRPLQRRHAVAGQVLCVCWVKCWVDRRGEERTGV